MMSNSRNEKIRVRKVRTGTILGSWGWTCLCCLNQPGWVGFMFMETAFEDGMRHVASAHPRIDWDAWR